MPTRFRRTRDDVTSDLVRARADRERAIAKGNVAAAFAAETMLNLLLDEWQQVGAPSPA